MTTRRPPRTLERLIERRLATDPHLESTLGDLAEGHAETCMREGRARGNLWYVRQTLSLLVRGTAPAGTGRPGPGTGERIRTDLRGARRAIVRRPAFSLGVIAVLAVSIGAALAAFSVTVGTWDAARWWQDDEATVLVWPEYPFSRGQLDVLRTETQAFSAVGGILRTPMVLATPDRSTSAGGVALSPELFMALRSVPAIGRGLQLEDAQPGAEPVAVIGHGLWQRAFGGAADVVGRVVEISGTNVRVVGVMPPGAEQPGPDTEVWRPLVLDPRDEDFWPARELSIAALVRPGVETVAARDDVRRVLGDLARRFSFFFQPDFGADATVVRSADVAWGAVSTPLLLLLGGTALLLLVAAIDVGNLVLARSITRAVEMRVRLALGASRVQLVRQILAESALLAGAAGCVGWLIGGLMAARLPGLFPFGTPVVAASAGDPVPALFALGLTLIAWAMMAAIPTVHLLGATRHVINPRAARTGSARGLVVAQAALATVLMVSAALLLRSVQSIERIPLGFDPAGVTVHPIAPPPSADASPANLDALYDGIAREVASARPVQHAGWISTVPLLDAVLNAPVNREDAPTPVAEAPLAARFVADAEALAALDVRVLRGRTFAETDGPRSAPVALINQTLARTLWPDRDAVGLRVAVDPHSWNSWITIVGVVEDVRFRDLTSAVPPAFFLPRSQAPTPAMRLIVKSGGATGALTPLVRSTLAALAPDVPAGDPRDLAGVVRDAQGPARVLTTLLSGLGILATILGAVGLYGALAGWVARRSVEIGTRLALGASPHRLSGRILLSGMGLTAVGVAIGSIGAIGAGRALRTLLFGVSPLDPLAFLLPALLLLATGVVAAALPALRAAAVPPARALRDG